jgi:hypothetical protein
MFSKLNAGDWLQTPIGRLQVRDLLGKGNSGYSYLARLGARLVVLKCMHDEKSAPGYRVQQDKVARERDACLRLKQLGMPIPELLYHDDENHYLVKEYIPGQAAHAVIADGQLQEEIISQLMAVAKKAKQSGINLDYCPDNFVIDGHRLIYIDYEVNDYTKEWDLENWGIYYWANKGGWRDYLVSGEPDALHADPDNRQPHRVRLQPIVDDWFERLGKV